MQSLGRLVRRLALFLLLGPGAVALALAGAAPGVASAGASAVVSMRDCSNGGGTTTVPPATPITIQNLGFAQGTYGLITNFLLKQRTTLTMSDGINTVYDLTSRWRAPLHLGSFWVTSLPNTHTGITVAPGQSIVAAFDITFAHPLLIAFPPVGSSGNNGPFRVSEDGPVSCVIRGAT